MKVKVIFWIRKKLFVTHGAIEDVDSETILDMGNLGVLLYSEFGIHSHYKDMNRYLKARFEYSVVDLETDIQIVELGTI